MTSKQQQKKSGKLKLNAADNTKNDHDDEKHIIFSEEQDIHSKLGSALKDRKDIDEIIDDGLLIANPRKVAPSLHAAHHDLSKKLSVRANTDYLQRMNVLKHPNIDASIQPQADDLEKALQNESQISPLYVDNKIAPSLAATSKQLNKAIKKDKLSQLLNDRPDQEEVYDSGCIKYKIHGPNSLCSTIQPIAVELESKLKQRVPSKYLKMSGVLLYDNDKVAPSLQSASYDLESALRHRPSLFDGSNNDNKDDNVDSYLQAKQVTVDPRTEIEDYRAKKDLLFQAYDRIDFEDNGDIDLDEFEKGMHTLNVSLTQGEIKQVFKLMDSDASNYVDRNEFTMFLTQRFESEELTRFQDVILRKLGARSRKSATGDGDDEDDEDEDDEKVGYKARKDPDIDTSIQPQSDGDQHQYEMAQMQQQEPKAHRRRQSNASLSIIDLQAKQVTVDSMTEIEDYRAEKDLLFQAYDKIDCDDNEDINLDEFEKGMHTLNVSLTQQEIKQVFKLMDSNACNYVDRNEFTMFLTQRFESEELTRFQDPILRKVQYNQ